MTEPTEIEDVVAESGSPGEGKYSPLGLEEPEEDNSELQDDGMENSQGRMSDRDQLLEDEVAWNGLPKVGKYQSADQKEPEEDAPQDNDMEKSQLQDPQGQPIYTVEDAVEKLGFGFFQVIITIFSGLLWVADAMELMLLSVLSPAVKCQWGLSYTEEALITTIVFIGFLIGGLFWGVLSDIIGRKKSLFIVDLTILLFGVLSAIRLSSDDAKIPGYPWLLFCRFGVGFGAGGTAQAVTYYAEFLPKKARGIAITFLEVWWAIGSIFGALLALTTMDTIGWHWFLGLAATPLALVLPFFLFVPESARFYIVKGKMDKAEKVIKRIAWFNRKPPLKGRLVTTEEKERLEIEANATESPVNTVIMSGDDGEEEGTFPSALTSNSEQRPLLISEHYTEQAILTRVEEEQKKASGWQNMTFLLERALIKTMEACGTLFSNGMWKTTLLLLFIWFGSAWLYYGIVLLTTSLLQHDKHCGLDSSDVNGTCVQLHQGDYLKILWTSAAELPGLLVTIVIIELLGRKKTMFIEFLVTMGGFLLLFVCAPELVIYFFLFIIRAFATGVFQAVYVYTPEVYPTKIRGAAMGVHTSAARVGALITPFVAQVLLPASDYATISLYAGSCLLLAIAAIVLPIETKGRSLKDSGA